MTTRQIRRAAERLQPQLFKQGLYAEQVATRKEDAAALDALKAELRAQYRPVNELAEQFWRTKRARIFEANILDNSDKPNLALLMTAVQRPMSSAEHGMYKSITS